MDLNPSIIEILKNRGIETEEDIEEYISDKPKKTYDPFLLHDMGAGVDLILSAIDNGDRITIYGDYDADGVTSVSLLRDILKELGGDVTYYIPSRFDDGYGLNMSALDKIKDAGAGLVVTVDCGSTSYDEVVHAQEIGLNILVTDHHAMGDRIPPCPIINPNHPDSKYPFRWLAGVGVAFKLAQALIDTVGAPKQILTRNLDLVAIGTVADVVPLVDENRTLVKFGLRALNISERPGLNALLDEIEIKKGDIKSRTISFIIGPHINSAGRVDNAALSAKLLQADDKEKASGLARELVNCNKKRRELQEETYRESKVLLEDRIVREETGDTLKDKFILLNIPGAHEGIIGIVAGKLKEEYGVPSIIVTEAKEGYLKGTGRSPDGIDLHELLGGHGELFEKFGGHKAACGFTISEEKLEDLNRALKEDTDKLYREKPERYHSELKIDLILPAKDVNAEFIENQNMMEPFGKGNERPVIGIELKDVEHQRMGAENQYIKVKGNLEDGRTINAVDFRNASKTEGELSRIMKEKEEVLAIGELEENLWNGNSYLRLNLKGVK